MARTQDGLVSAIEAATVPDFRNDLLARGRARALIMRDGVLPDDAPNFDFHLPNDLLSYGFSLLDHSLRLEELLSEDFSTKVPNEQAALLEQGYKAAAEALASVVTNAGTQDPDRDFHRLVAGCAYHFGRLAARAYSLVDETKGSELLLPGGEVVIRLLVRDVSGLREFLFETLIDEELDSLIESAIDRMAALDRSDENIKDERTTIVGAALTDHFLRSIAVALHAFELGDGSFLDDAVNRLTEGLQISANEALVEHWWLHRLAIRLLRDLWKDSFHERLPDPIGPFDGAAQARETYIAALFSRDQAELGLWPSQIEAADRAFDLEDDMVVALPTSAGKTRVAELCILATLVAEKRIVFVTPLRSLSAQTETSLRKTFGPLGAPVSALYGSIGDVGPDHDLLVDDKIVVATPEKLDFALRSDPDLLDDVGLIVLDEGHMIGTGQREVRYEVQVQRLLRRKDADQRRIVCLSAVLPSGDALDDFTEWLTGDPKGGRIESDWRPTELRFGEVRWFGKNVPGHARLDIDLRGQDTFVPRFIKGMVPPVGNRKKPFPADQRELCLATAWQFLNEGRTALVFCPQRRSVGPFATSIVDLHKRGALASVFRGDASDLDAACAIGLEWFGPDSDVIACLKLGVAIHHGSLPTPFRRELDRLIASGVLPLVISSPTLSQGLNLSASVLIFHGLKGGKDFLTPAEFRNVVGRAGRAYVDTEGLVLMPTFEGGEKRQKTRRAWRALIKDTKGREMRSGLARIVWVLFRRLKLQSGLKNIDEAIEYIANTDAWSLQRLKTDRKDQEWQATQRQWADYLDSLDTAILALLGEVETESVPDVAALLDDLLASSLWEHTLEGLKHGQVKRLKATLEARTRIVFEATTPTQRRFFFLAGVGLSNGHAIEKAMPALGPDLLAAEAALILSDADETTAALIRIAEIVFSIPPFIPNDLRADWKDLLRTWLAGDPLPHEDGDSLPRFVEDAFVYRLVWALEVIRLRSDLPDATETVGYSSAEVEIGRAALAVECGTSRVPEALLLRAGLGSRQAARAAVERTSADFDTRAGLRAWRLSPHVRSLQLRLDWPTPETRAIWKSFQDSIRKGRSRKWRLETTKHAVRWTADSLPIGTVLSLRDEEDGKTGVYSIDLHRVGILESAIQVGRIGVTIAWVGPDGEVSIRYIGPDRR
ncbi:DEAD/DEAH box helicase [Sagittula sp. NFXS13]|uniref:DEAD/DEAH box helicase n=1 Tax=Sagittula sp. NFXS13 TaxID=2819095 RepID=UPI0032E02242